MRLIGAWGAALASVVLACQPGVRDIDGKEVNPLQPGGAAQLLFFLAPDCPISNFYAPQIQAMCGDYASRGVTCALVYADPRMKADEARKHRVAFGYGRMTAILDADHELVHAANASVTPQAVLIARGGKIVYSGRIDNFYAALGRPRRQATTHELRDALEETLAGTSVTIPRTEVVGCNISSLEAVQQP